MFFVPTRGRPERLQKFLDACADTGMTMPGLIVVDGADGGDYSGVHVPENWRLEVAPDRAETCGRMEAYFRRHPNADFYSIINDDVVPLTFGWDEILAAAVGDWNVAYPDDCLSGEKMATQFLVGGKLARAVGSFGLGFIHTQVDRAWMDIGRGIDRLVYVKTVKLRHDHWSNGAAARDETYERTFNGQSTIPHDRKRYGEFVTREYVSLIQRLQKVMV